MGVSFQKILQNCVLTRPHIIGNEKHESYEQSSQCALKSKSKTGGDTPPEGQFRSEISLVPCFFSPVYYCVHPDLTFRP
jgi:hypothetical protein